MSNKIRFGEVFTDISLVQDILDLIPQEKYLDPTLRWLDPAAGNGNFMKILSKINKKRDPLIRRVVVTILLKRT